MKHFKLWCLILAIFVGLSAILLIGTSEKSARTIASIETGQALNAELDQLIAEGDQLTTQEAGIKAEKLIEKIETATTESATAVNTIYTRGEEIVSQVETLQSLEEMDALNDEIKDLQDKLNLQSEELTILLSLIERAAKENNSLATPLKGIKERLEATKNKIEKANLQIATIEEKKPAVVEQLESQLLIARAKEIEDLKKKNCDMELTICRQEDELSKLQADVEKLIEDKQEVVETVMPQSSLGIFGLMLQMQLNNMTAMMNNFSLYYPRVSSTPFSNSFNYSPRYDFDLINNYVSYGQYMPEQNSAQGSTQQKSATKIKNTEKNGAAAIITDATLLSDNDVTKGIDSHFGEAVKIPSPWDIEATTSFLFN